MNFNLDEDQLMFREGIRRFVGERYEFTTQRRRIASASATDRQMWTRFAEMGWLGVFVEESSGGLGWSLTKGAIVLEELGRGLVIEPYLEQALLAARLLGRCDVPAASEVLPRIAAGETMVTVGLSEADSRYNYGRPSCTATTNGSAFRLNGRKILVAAADAADSFLVSAHSVGSLALFLVNAKAPGVSQKLYRLLDGSWASDIAFADVALEPDALLAKGATARDILEWSIDEAALGAAAEALGCIDSIVEMTAEYLRTRKQFGQPLAKFQALQHRMADLFIEAEMARSALHSALSVIDGPAKERQAAVSGARVRVDQAGQRIGNQGIHLHGGMGMTMEYPVGHYVRRLMLLSRAYGDTEYHLERYERLMVAAA